MILMKKRVLNMNPGGDFCFFWGATGHIGIFELSHNQRSGWSTWKHPVGVDVKSSEMPNVKPKLLVLMAGWIAND